MRKIDGLPHGACSRIAAQMGVSAKLVQAVARGERQNVRIYEELLKVKREHVARMKRIERIKAKLDEMQIGKIDTRQS